MPEEALRTAVSPEAGRAEFRGGFAPAGDLLPFTPEAAGVPALPEAGSRDDV